MADQNPAPETNRGLLGTDADPSGHGVKTNVQENPTGPAPKQDVGAVSGSDTAATVDSSAAAGLKGGSSPTNTGPTPHPFRDAVENEARAMDLEETGLPDLPPDEANRTAPGDNLKNA